MSAELCPTQSRRRTRSQPLQAGLQLWRLVGSREMTRIVAQRLRGPRAQTWYPAIVQKVAGKSALEIGGPSPIFWAGSAIPIYPLLKSCDDVDFAPSTLWTEPSKSTGRGGLKIQLNGRRFLLDATELAKVPSDEYEVVISSHVVEHIANPIRALREWRRVLADRGVILAVVPEGARTFDHNRSPTTLEHLQQDFDRGVTEDDLSHLPEILSKHDLTMDPGILDPAAFAERSRRNLGNRALHHHVFAPENLRGLLSLSGFSVEVVARVAPAHLLVLGQKSTSQES